MSQFSIILFMLLQIAKTPENQPYNLLSQRLYFARSLFSFLCFFPSSLSSSFDRNDPTLVTCLCVCSCVHDHLLAKNTTKKLYSLKPFPFQSWNRRFGRYLTAHLSTEAKQCFSAQNGQEICKKTERRRKKAKNQQFTMSNNTTQHILNRLVYDK